MAHYVRGKDGVEKLITGRRKVKEMEYTKGDWRYTIIGLESKVVDENVGIVAHIGERNTLEEIEANAHLIAQGPRMAELILKVSKQGYSFFPEDRRNARDIILAIS